MKKLLSTFVLLGLTAFSQTPNTITMSPSSGYGYVQTFAISAKFPAGSGNGDFLLLSLGGIPGCTFHFRPLDHVMYIINNAGDGWQQQTVIGSNATLQNNYCGTNASTAFTQVSVINGVTTETAWTQITLNAAGANPGWTGAYAYSGACACTSNWVTTGTWTMNQPPSQSYDRASFTAFLESDSPRQAVSSMTNQPMYLEDALHPLPTINLDTINGDNPAVIIGGTMATVDIQHAKPNAQVWARGYGFDPTSHNPDGTPEFDRYYMPNPQAFVYSSTIWPSAGDMFPGGWLVGSTDANGHFTLDFQVGTPFGDNSIQIYVGNETVNSQVGLDGVTRQNYNASLNPANYFGAVTFFTTDMYNSNLPSPFYAQEKEGKPGPKSQKLIESCQKAHPVSESDHIACIQKGLEDPQLDQK